LYQSLTAAQLKQQIDAEQAFSAWQDAVAKAQDFRGGMHWKTVSGKEYLYKTLDRKGNAKSLGARSEKTQSIESHFTAQKVASSERVKSLGESIDIHAKINAALRLGSAPVVVADLCLRLHQAGLLGHSLMVIGTNSLFAYEAMAGVRFDKDILATTDIDLLWDHKARVRLAVSDDIAEPSLLALLQKVDKTFQIVQGQSFRAANDKGYMVDLIRQMPNPPWRHEPDRFFTNQDIGTSNGSTHSADLIATDIWNMKWLLNAPRVQQTAIAVNGQMFPLCVPDPRAYAMFKLWLGQSLERNPLKKSRDLAQAKALVSLVQDKLPHLAKDWHQIRSFPADIAKQVMAQLTP
jgi:hypothetical protein